MILADSSNVYIGGKVKDGDNEYTVVKVNKSSMYITNMSYGEFREKKEKNSWLKWKEFCKENNIESVKYGKYFINEEDLGRKDLVEKNEKLEESYCKMINNTSNVLDTYWNNKGFLRVLGKKEDCYLLNINGDVMLYCSSNREKHNLCKIHNYDYSSIPWEKLSKYSNL